MKSVKDKVAVITGAGSGIGRALAQQLSKEGAHLALSDISMKGLEETQASLTGSGKVSLRELDVSDRDDFYRYADEVVAEFGHADMVIQ